MSSTTCPIYSTPCSRHHSELGNAVHVIVAYLRLQLLLRALRKEERKERAIFCPVSVSQHLLKLIAPGKRHFLLAQLRIKALLTDISKLRLIGEKSGDRFTEFIGIFGIVRLVDAFNLRMGGHLIDHVDIGRISAVGSCAVDHVDAPLPLRKLKGSFSVLTQICQIHDVLMEYMSFLIAKRHCSDERISSLFRVIDRITDLPETDGRLEHPRDVQRKRSARSVNVDRRAGNILLFALRMLLDQAVGVAGGKMLVIEDPDLHVSLFCFVQDDVHIVPPARSAEILVGPRLHAHGADPALGNFRDLLADHFFRLTAHPKKRKNIVVIHNHLFNKEKSGGTLRSLSCQILIQLPLKNEYSM